MVTAYALLARDISLIRKFSTEQIVSNTHVCWGDVVTAYAWLVRDISLIRKFSMEQIVSQSSRSHLWSPKNSVNYGNPEKRCFCVDIHVPTSPLPTHHLLLADSDR